MGIFRKKPKEKETTIWEDFGITEPEWDKIERSVQHCEIDSDTWIAFAKNLFPNSKEDAVKAFILGHKMRESVKKD